MAKSRLPGQHRPWYQKILGVGENTTTDFVGAAATFTAANLVGERAKIAETQRQVTLIAEIVGGVITDLGGNPTSFKAQIAYLATKVQGDPGVQLKLTQVATEAAEDHLINQLIARRASRTAEPPTA